MYVRIEGLSKILNGLILWRTISKMATQIINIPKYKLKESNVKYLLKNEPIRDPGSNPNKKIDPF